MKTKCEKKPNPRLNQRHEKKAKYWDVDEAVVEWFVAVRNQKQIVTCRMLIKKNCRVCQIIGLRLQNLTLGGLAVGRTVKPSKIEGKKYKMAANVAFFATEAIFSCKVTYLIGFDHRYVFSTSLVLTSREWRYASTYLESNFRSKNV